MRRVLGLFVSLVLAAPTVAMAHGRLSTPLNRSKASDASNTDSGGGLCGLNTCASPCGGVAKPAAATNSYLAGSNLNLVIETTIAHTGSQALKEEYDLYWSPSGDSTTALFTNIGTAPTPIAQYFPTKVATPPTYTTNETVKLPSTPATNGTLQMVMVDADQVPTLYWVSCIDITLTAAVTGDGGETLDMTMGPDLSAAVDAGPLDLAGSPPADMTKRPSAGKAGLPGCSMSPGEASGSSLGAIALLLALGLMTQRRRLALRRS